MYWSSDIGHLDLGPELDYFTVTRVAALFFMSGCFLARQVYSRDGWRCYRSRGGSDEQANQTSLPP